MEDKKWSRTFAFNTGKARHGRGDGLGLAILNTIGRLGGGGPYLSGTRTWDYQHRILSPEVGKPGRRGWLPLGSLDCLIRI